MKTSEKTLMLLMALLIGGMILLGLFYEPDYTRSLQTPAGGQTGGAMDSRVIPQGWRGDSLPDAQSEGARHLALYCAQCHDLPPPAMHGADEWPAIVLRMQTYMAQRQGGMLIRLLRPAEKDWQVLQAYLVQNAQQSLSAQQLAAIDDEGGLAFVKFCGQCHAVPDPRQHSPQVWARTVLRMVEQMRQAGKPVPAEDVSETIVDYLRRAAQTPPAGQ